MAAEPTSTGVTPRRWERFAPFGALGFLLSIVVGAVLIGETTPSSQAPAREIAAYFHDHSGGILANTALVVLGGFASSPGSSAVSGGLPAKPRATAASVRSSRLSPVWPC